MKVLTGDQLLIGFYGADPIEVATVLDVTDQTLAIAVHKVGCPYEAGAELALRHKRGDWRGKASISAIEPTRNFLILHLHDITAEGTISRARRHEYSLNVAADYLNDAENLKRTIGHTSNLSSTGVRVRVRSPLKKGTAARLVIRLSAESVVEVLARVVRIIPGSESNGGGYDIGFHFERILSGFDALMEVAPDAKGGGLSGPPVPQEAEEDDWFSTPDVG